MFAFETLARSDVLHVFEVLEAWRQTFKQTLTTVVIAV
jgi:hypothetical protein